MLTLDNKYQQAFISLEKVYLPELEHRIIEAPEKFIFILSTSEWETWLKHIDRVKVLFRNKDQIGKENLLDGFLKEHENDPGISIIIAASNPTISKRYKIGCVTPMELGDCFAVFFTDPLGAIKRAKHVTKAVLDFKAELRKKPPLS
jgi:hypothetical protein